MYDFYNTYTHSGKHYCLLVKERFYQVSGALHHWALGAVSLSPVQQTGRPGSQRSAVLRINRHEPLARMFSAAREEAHSQISTNQKWCQSEHLSLWAPSGSGPIQEKQIPPGWRGQEDKQGNGRWRSTVNVWTERRQKMGRKRKEEKKAVLLFTVPFSAKGHFHTGFAFTHFQQEIVNYRIKLPDSG